MLKNYKTNDLKGYNYKEIELLCEEIRSEIIRTTLKNGGHLSSNLGVVELTVALHKYYSFERDKVLFDVGHQCYTHKILTGRSLENLRCTDGVAGFPKIKESIYDVFEGGHSSNSISNALGFAISRDLKNENYNIVCVIGDASISNGLAFEALNDINLSKHKIIIILNDNGMSISQNVGNTSKLFSRISTSGLYNKTKLGYKRFTSKTKFGKKFYEICFIIKNAIKRFLIRGNIFIDLGLDYIGAIDGHNVKAIEKALKRAEKSIRTTVIHLKTIKGLGYKIAEDDIFGYYHGISPKKDTINNEITWSEFYSIEFEKLIKDNNDIVLISPATLVGSKFERLQKEMPDRVFDVGIAEEHALSLAAGLALSNLRPYVSIYSTFLQRAFDELSHDSARMNLNITCLIDRCGLANGDGDTHHGIFDESFLINTPNTVVCMASNIKDAAFLLNDSLNNRGVYCIRYPKGEIPTIFNETFSYNLSFGTWYQIINKKSDTMFITFGPIINDIKNYIMTNNLNIDLVNALFQKPLDINFIKKASNEYKKIIIYNIYGTKNGFNNLVINELVNQNYKGMIKSFALELKFEPTKTIYEALKDEKLDLDSIFAEINNE